MSIFLAWMPDASTVRALRRLCDGLAAEVKLAWREDAQLHVTLRYLGQPPIIDPAALHAAVACVALRHPSLELSIQRLERWQDDDILVACVARSSALDALFVDLEAAVVASGFPAQTERPSPHVTLAFARRGERVVDAACNDADGRLPIASRLERISLAQTVRGGYTSLGSWPLQAPATTVVDPAAHPR